MGSEMCIRDRIFDSKEKILVGERGGKKLDGFDLGNSPLGVSTERVKGEKSFYEYYQWNKVTTSC